MTFYNQRGWSFSGILLVFLCCLTLPSAVFAEPGESEKAEVPSGLAAALQATIANNPAVKGVQAELDARGFDINSAKASRYPTVSVEASNLDSDFDEGVVTVKQPLWAFGKIDNEIAYAKANHNTKTATVLQVKRQLIENTAVAYAAIEGIEKRIAVATLSIEEHDQLYQQVLRRFEGHLASEADMRLAYSRLIQARSDLVSIQGELQIALSDLHNLTQVEVNVDEPVDKKYAQLPELAEVKALAQENSANVQVKEQTIDEVELDIKREKLAVLPILYYQFDYHFIDEPSSGDRAFNGLVIEGKLDGLGFQAYGRVKSAIARQNSAREDLKSAQNDVSNRVNNLMISRSIREQLRAAKQEAVEVVEMTKTSFVRQYESGRKSWIDVLNTQRELTELRTELAKIENDWLILSLRIVALTGGLDALAGVESTGIESTGIESTEVESAEVESTEVER